MATITLIYNFLISYITSLVCFLTPSDAETIKTTKSVTEAPLCLMFTKASCPGVSMNVIRCPKQFILKAPIL